MALSLTRYWLEVQLFEDVVTTRYFGVTAHSLEDTLTLLHAHPQLSSAVIIQAWPNIDVSTLDSGHVLPNMLPPNRRGVWYPIL